MNLWEIDINVIGVVYHYADAISIFYTKMRM